jgi:hypothetical protein
MYFKPVAKVAQSPVPNAPPAQASVMPASAAMNTITPHVVNDLNQGLSPRSIFFKGAAATGSLILFSPCYAWSEFFQASENFSLRLSTM